MKLKEWIEADKDKPLWYVRPWVFGTVVGTIAGAILAIVFRTL